MSEHLSLDIDQKEGHGSSPITEPLMSSVGGHGSGLAREKPRPLQLVIPGRENGYDKL